MNAKIKILRNLTLALLFTAPAYASTPHWGYMGHNGPLDWDHLALQFLVCGVGKNQSPIDIEGEITAKLPKLDIDYQDGSKTIVDNGHAIKVDFNSGSVAKIGTHEFELKQVHFHTPSENKIHGKSYPMEAHFVNADKDGNLLVVSVMFEQGKENTSLQKVLAKMPTQAGKQIDFAVDFNASDLLPQNVDYYRYNGSLTTPPCTEGVTWMVMKSPNHASKEQIDQLYKAIGFANNRPLQPINAREILQ